MTNFLQTIQDFKGEYFRQTLKRQIKSLVPGSLPLEKGLTQGGYVDDRDIDVTVLNNVDSEKNLTLKLGIFFTEIVINCGCGDDPMPVNGYCEMQMIIDKQSGAAGFEVID